MCALQIISQSKNFSKNEDDNINEINHELIDINTLLSQCLDS